ncbi:MAG: carbohydrate ABC transporter permease [Nitrospinota bacterium]|nr:carbohydrate ABC transporter permease [Nitrospinota bacterium]
MDAARAPDVRMAKWYRRSAIAGRIMLYAIVAFMLFYALSPFYWMLNSSLQLEKDVVSVPPNWVPPQVTLNNFSEIVLRKPADVSVEFDKKMAGYSTFPTADVLPSMWNSFVVAVGVLVVNVVLGSLAAYGFARLRFAGKQYLFYMVLASRIVPEVSLIVPFYLLIRSIGLLDSYLGLIVTYIPISLPLVIFVLVSYFETIPRDIENAARVDGCDRFQTLWRVILPLSTPAIVTAGMFAFLTSWNEFLFPLVLTQTMETRPITVTLLDFVSEFSVSYARMNAAGIACVIVPVALALIFQRYFVRGLTAGAVKG